MPIPVGRQYQKKELGNGTVGTTENNVINTITAGEDINYGVGVVIKDHKAVTATKAPILGIAIRRDFTWGEHYSDIEKDHWYEGEKVGVMRKGGVSVPITTDVDRWDEAAVNADGTFKTAGASDPVIGHFITDGNAGSTAILTIELADTQIASTAQSVSTPTAPTTPSNPSSQSGNNTSATKKEGDK